MPFGPATSAHITHTTVTTSVWIYSTTTDTTDATTIWTNWTAYWPSPKVWTAYWPSPKVMTSEEALDRQKADQRAKELMMNCLSPEQRDEYERHKRFHVITPSGKKYRINKGTHGNIALLGENDRVLEKLCVQPEGIPKYDAMLAQKLWLETDEEKVRKVANITNMRGFQAA